MTDAIPGPVQALMALFSSDLSEVKFPDVDAGVLARAAASVEAAAEVLSRAEAAVEAARVDLADAQEALLLKAQRAHAYARVYGESDVELSGRIDSIQLARSSRRGLRDAGRDVARDGGDVRAIAIDAAPRRRGRPPKEAATSPLLDATTPCELTPPALEH